MPEEDRDVESYYEYNWLGRAVSLGGLAARGAATLIDRGLKEAATTLKEAERAFKEELDPNIEDAKILEERDEPRE